MRLFVCRRPLVETLLLLLATLAAGQQCFWPDGSVDGGAVACGPSGASMCCSAGSQCTSNKLCVVDDPVAGWEYFRGSCTDSTWQDPACPTFCDGGEIFPLLRKNLTI
jgi:hypothetical protein